MSYPKPDIISLQTELLERFVRYAKITTTSDDRVETVPSTQGQWELLDLLEKELAEIGITELTLSEHGFLVGRIPANSVDESVLKNGTRAVPVIGLMAHVDTSQEAPGDNVEPQVHVNYDGGVIKLKEGYSLDPGKISSLASYKGDTVITSDGTTLLGADDKAGIAIIMTAAHWLMRHPEYPHGSLEIIFNADEETARGTMYFPKSKVKASFVYTLDGDKEGSIEAECFNAYKAVVICTGVSEHPGTGRGKLVNAITMAAAFISMLPRNESAEATDGYYGFYFPKDMNASVEKAEIELLIRDFKMEEIERRISALKVMAAAVEAGFPGGKVRIQTEKQYLNMKEYVAKSPKVVEYLLKAAEEAGVEPFMKPIRGGTDGSRLSEMGIPSPNIFTGGFNFHSRTEWIPLSVMAKSALTVLNLVRIWRTDETS